MCAFTACVRFLRRRGPAGLREPFLWLLRGHFGTAMRFSTNKKIALFLWSSAIFLDPDKHSKLGRN